MDNKIRRILESVYGEKVFNVKDTDIPIYNNMLKKPDYFKNNKRREFNIERMTPDEYMRKSADIHNSSVSNEMRAIDEDIVEEYADLMEGGEEFPMPFLDFADGYQEGRHRVLAFKRVADKGSKLPVMVITKYEGEIKYPEGDIRNKYL